MFSRISNIFIGSPRFYLGLSIILIVLGGVFQTATADTEANKALGLRMVDELWNQGNLAVADEFLAPNFVNHDSSSNVTVLESYKGWVMSNLTGFPDFHLEIHDMVAEGDKVAARWTFTGTHQGEVAGIPPTGKSVSATGMNIHRFADGKIVEGWWNHDTMALLQQLGVITPGRPAPENYEWSAPSEVTGEAGEPEANIALGMRYADEVWNQGNLDVIDEIFNAEPIRHDPATDYAYGPSSIEILKQTVTDYRTAFPDFHITLDDVFAEGDKGVSRWTLTGTHLGELMGMPATGKSVSATGMNILRFADGKIVETWWAWDLMGLMQQLTAQIIPEGLTVDEITSASLEGNLLGDPATREVIVYLPPSYDQGGNFPVVYLLHGYTGNARTFTSDGFTGLYWPADSDFPEDGLYGMLNEMIAAGELGEMIVVMPDGSNTYGGSFYTNSELTGNYEDYIVNDLVSYIDSNYRTIPSRNSRAIMGHSMGGYGAMKLAMKHPDVFGAAAAHSGLLYLDALRPMMPAIVAENPDGMMGPDPGKQFTSMVYVLSAAFSPNLANPPFFVDLPFEYPSGVIIDEVWGKYMANDPFTMLSTYGANLASTRGIFLDVGEQDELVPPPVVDAFHQVLTAAGIDHEYEVFAGNHYNRLFERLRVSLKFLSDALVAESQKDYTNVFFMSLAPGLNMISLPLEPITPYTARSFAEELSATTVIQLDEVRQRFVGFTLDAPDDGFAIEGGKGYIVNVPEGRVVTFTGAAWTNQPPVEASPSLAQSDSAWAFVVSGNLDVEQVDNLFHVTIRNTRTNTVATDVAREGYFAAAFADLTRKNVVEVGDRLEVTVRTDEFVSDPFIYTVTPENIRQAYLPITLKNVDIPRQSLLLQNYPNPFNPETWIPYQLREPALVVIRIYDVKGQLAHTIDLG
ncbi:alpha/beta fold hydrolase, partial [bacterium]|nr:alpha/beta fold hydrolase [bacterium]